MSKIRLFLFAFLAGIAFAGHADQNWDKVNKVGKWSFAQPAMHCLQDLPGVPSIFGSRRVKNICSYPVRIFSCTRDNAQGGKCVKSGVEYVTSEIAPGQMDRDKTGFRNGLHDPGQTGYYQIDDNDNGSKEGVLQACASPPGYKYVEPVPLTRSRLGKIHPTKDFACHLVSAEEFALVEANNGKYPSSWCYPTTYKGSTIKGMEPCSQ